MGWMNMPTLSILLMTSGGLIVLAMVNDEVINDPKKIAANKKSADSAGSTAKSDSEPSRSDMVAGASTQSEKPPHILFILADDLGYNDLGYRHIFRSNDGKKTTVDTNVSTPIIDRLASEGVVLNNYYVTAVCTPTRATIMTGRYTFRYGLGPWVIAYGAPYGLPGDETTMAQVLWDAGYATHMVGKWHLGMVDKRYTPTFRGFESFFGYFGSHTHYTMHMGGIPRGIQGLDFHNSSLNSVNVSVPNTDKYMGKHSTEVFADRVDEIVENHIRETNPRPLFLYLALQSIHSMFTGAPQEYLNLYPVEKQGGGKDGALRQMRLAMIAAMDGTIERVEKTFKDAQLWDDTIVVFTTDNGGNTQGPNWPGGSNFPLRGAKFEDWEGGIRGNAFVRGSKHWPITPNGVTDELMHSTDWLPTLARVAGASTRRTKPLDGHDIWDVLSQGKKTARESIVHSCPPKGEDLETAATRVGASAVYRKEHLKLMYANTNLLFGKYSFVNPDTKQIPEVGSKGDEGLLCKTPTPVDGKFLFNITADPRECTNLAGTSKFFNDTLAKLIKELSDVQNGVAVADLKYAIDRCVTRGDREMHQLKPHTGQDETGKPLKYSYYMHWEEWDCAADKDCCGWPIR